MKVLVVLSALALGLADNTHLDFNGYHKNLIVS